MLDMIKAWTVLGAVLGVAWWFFREGDGDL